MSWGATRVGLILCVIGLAGQATPVAASTFALKAVKINDVVIDPPQSTVFASPGDTIEVEIFISGWADEIPDGVRAYSAMIANRQGALSGDSGTVLPLSWNAPLNPQFCTSTDECEAEKVCLFSVCADEGHEPPLSGFIDLGRPDFILAGLAPFTGVGTRLPDYSYIATATLGTASDPETETYGGTLVLVASEFACGTFTFSLIGAETFLADEDSAPFFPDVLAPLVIEVDDCEPFVQGSDPPACAIDAGVPYDPYDVETTFGWDAIDIEFIAPAEGMTCADFTVGTIPPSEADSVPGCVGVTTLGSTASINLDSIIPLGKWTCFLHNDSYVRTCIGFLPGDADTSVLTVVEPADVDALVSNLSGAVPSMELYQCDVDRSNECTPLDLLSTIDLLNGAEGFDSWNGATIPAACPRR